MHRFRKPVLFSVRLNVTTARLITTVDANRNGLSLCDIPRPKSLPLLGTKIEFIASGSGSKLHEYAHKRHKALGPIFCENFTNTDIVFISNPQMIKMLFLKHEGKYPAHILPDPWVLYEKLYGSKRGLFFMDGEEWLTNRRIMNKYLLREDAEKWLHNNIKQVIENFLDQWKIKAKYNNIVPNLESEFYRLSIDVIIAILIGTKSQNMSSHHDELLSIFSESVKKIFQTTTKLLSLPLTWCHRLNLKPWRDFKESVDTSLLLAQKLVSEMLTMTNVPDGLIPKLKGENISQEIITRIVADLIIAAGDTTAYTLLWTLYLLSKNEEVPTQIRNSDITYSKFVLRESMRLYPVAPFLTRILPKVTDLGPYQLKEGTPVVASIYTSGRDENYFSDADKFLPYRWDRNDSRRKELENFEASASLPFAIGVRSCVGKRIAILQLTEFIKQVVDNFDFKRSNDNEINAVTSQVLVPDKSIQLIFSLRKQ